MRPQSGIFPFVRPVVAADHSGHKTLPKGPGQEEPGKRFALWPVWSRATTDDAKHFVRAHIMRPQSGTGNDQKQRSSSLTVGAHCAPLRSGTLSFRRSGTLSFRRSGTLSLSSGRILCAHSAGAAPEMRRFDCGTSARQLEQTGQAPVSLPRGVFGMPNARLKIRDSARSSL